VKRFEEYCQSEIRSLTRHLRDYGRRQKPEALHQMRVEVKKIKAIMAVINGCVREFKAHKNFIPFRNIFRKAGSIREPEVLARLLTRYKVDETVDQLMPGNAKRNAAAFASDVPRMVSVVKKSAKKLEVISKKVHHDDFESYVVDKKKEVKSQLYPRPRMTIIHKVRKGIKEVVYLSALEDHRKKGEAKFYDNMQNVIGRLHDKQVMLDLLKNKNARAHRAQLSAIRLECLSDKKEIVRLATDFYKK